MSLDEGLALEGDRFDRQPACTVPRRSAAVLTMQPSAIRRISYSPSERQKRKGSVAVGASRDGGRDAAHPEPSICGLELLLPAKTAVFLDRRRGNQQRHPPGGENLPGYLPQ